jgi:hypothetical protein
MAVMLAEINESVETLTEKIEGGAKKYTIAGIFMQSEAVNHNGRIYPKHLMEREVALYTAEKVLKNQALGELNHPANRVSVDPREASHLITELSWDGNDVRGVAKILDTPCGKIVKALMDEQVSFGVSSRALGSLRKRQDGINEVQNDFSLKCVDIVSSPSAHGAWMQSIMEGKEWTCVDGIWSEQNIDEAKSAIRRAPKAQIEIRLEEEFTKFMNSFK